MQVKTRSTLFQGMSPAIQYSKFVTLSYLELKFIATLIPFGCDDIWIFQE